MLHCVGNRTLVSLLQERVALSPQNTFVVHEDEDGHVEELTYKDFYTHVAAVSHGLKELGIGYDTKVCIHMSNRLEFLIAFFALASLRAVAVPTNTANTAREMIYALNHGDVEWIITEQRYVTMLVDEVLPHVAGVKKLIVVGDRFGEEPDVGRQHLTFKDLYNRPHDLAGESPRPEDVVEFIYTSGTTSNPKAVMITHHNVMWSGIESSKHLLFTPEDRNLTSLPLFHVNAQGTLFGTMAVGGTLVLLQRYSASRYMQQVRRHKATTISLVATLLRTILMQPVSPDDRNHNLRIVKFAINVSDEEKAAFEERFGVPLINGYGLTEAMVTVAGSPIYGDLNWPSVGLPVLGREVAIVDDGGRPLPPGEIGEITVKGVPGKNLMLGYYKDPAATAEALRDGWLFTGDLAYMDERGYLYYQGRKKDMIKRGGENVSAMEVEVVLCSHPNVEEAAVIGIPDPVYDQAVKAFVVLKEPGVTSEQELISFCQGRLAKFKVPSVIELRDSLPKTSIGKIAKKVLMEEEA